MLVIWMIPHLYIYIFLQLYTCLCICNHLISFHTIKLTVLSLVIQDHWFHYIKSWIFNFAFNTTYVGARVVRNVAFFHYPSWTDSIKPSLQFLRYFVACRVRRYYTFTRIKIFNDLSFEIVLQKHTKDENGTPTHQFIIPKNKGRVSHFYLKLAMYGECL
jgi:hypothetical protein